MPYHSLTETVQRWRALDAALGSQGVNIFSFARQWKVTAKTVQRDLKVFESLGQVTVWVPDEQGRYWHRYDGGECLFTANLQANLRRVLGRLRCQVDWERVGTLLRLLEKNGMSLSELIESLREEPETSV
jgi:hypothetical protein